MKGHRWAPEDTERLRVLIAAGATASQAAAAFPGRTRNAILGHADRQGFELSRCSSKGTANKVKAAKLRVSRPTPPTRKYTTTAQERAAILDKIESVTGVLLEDLVEAQCAYAVTDTLPFRFCGRSCASRKSRYCEDHGSVVHQKVQLARL